MKVVLVHDYLNQLGGGERVLTALMKMFPTAPVFTLLHDKEKTRGAYASRVKKTSFLDVPFVRNHHRLFIPLMPLAIESLNLGNEFDLVISDTAGFAKGIKYGGHTKHLSYIHTPLRYAWETKTYFDKSFKNYAMRFLAAPAFSYVRRWDFKAGQRPDILLANSYFIADKVKLYYKCGAKVVYPPVDLSKFYFDSASYQLQNTSYYLAVGRFLEYKKFDLIIKAFNQSGLPLKIVGTGRQEQYLKSIANHNIEFLPFQAGDDALRKLYANAKAFVIAHEEDFGLVTAEAQACGTPVIGLNIGGTPEIVKQRKAGVLFNDQTPEALNEAVAEFETLSFDRHWIAKEAKRFSEENFRKGIEEAVGGIYK